MTSMQLHQRTAFACSGDIYVLDIVDNSNGMLAASASDNAIKLYDSSINNALMFKGSLTGHECNVSSMAFSPVHVDILASSSKDGSVALWDTRLTSATHRFLVPNRTPICSVTVAGGSGNIIAAGTAMEDAAVAVNEPEASIVLWDIRSPNQPIATFKDTHSDDITCLAFSPGVGSGDTVLASASMDGLVCIYDLSNGNFNEEEALTSIFNNEESIAQIGFFGPNYEYLHSLSHMETLKLWSLSQGDMLSSLDHVKGQTYGSIKVDYLTKCHYMADTQRLYLLAGSYAGKVGLFHVNADHVTLVSEMCGGHTETLRCAEWVVKGSNSTIVTGAEDSMLALWSDAPLPENDPSLASPSMTCDVSAQHRSKRSFKPY